MQFFVTVLIAMFAAAAAFMPHKSIKAPVTTLSMKSDSFKPATLIPAAMIPFVMPLMTLAAEGTSRAFGIDDNRLIFAALAPSLIIFPLYSKWSKEQEPDDFFDGYEKRRNG